MNRLSFNSIQQLILYDIVLGPLEHEMKKKPCFGFRFVFLVIEPARDSRYKREEFAVGSRGLEGVKLRASIPPEARKRRKPQKDSSYFNQPSKNDWNFARKGCFVFSLEGNVQYLVVFSSLLGCFNFPRGVIISLNQIRSSFSGQKVSLWFPQLKDIVVSPL